MDGSHDAARRAAIRGALALPLAARSATAQTPKPPAAIRRSIVAAGAVQVPRDFIAMHFHRWPRVHYPGSTVSPAPTYRYGTVRSLNYDGILWRDLHRAPGEFTFDHLDHWVDTHWRAGKTLIYTVYGTPRWATTRPQVNDLYQQPGGDSKPRDLGQLAEFVTRLVARYNGDGRQRIRFIESWNEPEFTGVPYWRDSAEDLAALSRTIYGAAKAVDPAILVLFPPFTHLIDGPRVYPKMVDYAFAKDGRGGRGRDWADALTFHYYHYGGADVTPLLDTIDGVRLTRAAIGRPQWPIYLTELGEGEGWSPQSPPSAEKATRVCRWLAVSAAAGLRIAGLYSHESDHLGQPAHDATVAAAIDRMHLLLAGRTISDAAILADRTVWLRLDDGRTATW